MGGKKGAPDAAVRTAEYPGQAINVDLCFVPEQHAAQERLPAVSGSSGHLVVARPRPSGEEARWPGQVFADAAMDYVDAMHHYAEATRERLVRRRSAPSPARPKPTHWRHEWAGRAARYRVREQRKQEELAWGTAKTAWRETRQAYAALTRSQRRAQRAAYALAKQAWEAVRHQRRETLARREAEDQAWHQRNRARRPGAESAARSWIAVLVVTDNCTRQCLGLPLFRSGPRLTSGEVVAALQALLPADLAFVISDQGTHFRSQAFAALAEQADFIHIPVYRHRPESNGIAERFVLTLKNWLQSQSWEGVEALEALLGAFRPEYNDRPHQGLAIPGLSPNEFARRIWLM